MIKGVPLNEEEFKKSMHYYMKKTEETSGEVTMWRHVPSKNLFPTRNAFDEHVKKWEGAMERNKRAEAQQIKKKKIAKVEIVKVRKEIMEENEKLNKHASDKQHFINTEQDTLRMSQAISDSSTLIEKHKTSIQLLQASLKNHKISLDKRYQKLHPMDRKKINSLQAKELRLKKWL